MIYRGSAAIWHVHHLELDRAITWPIVSPWFMGRGRWNSCLTQTCAMHALCETHIIIIQMNLHYCMARCLLTADHETRGHFLTKIQCLNELYNRYKPLNSSGAEAEPEYFWPFKEFRCLLTAGHHTHGHFGIEIYYPKELHNRYKPLNRSGAEAEPGYFGTFKEIPSMGRMDGCLSSKRKDKQIFSR